VVSRAGQAGAGARWLRLANRVPEDQHAVPTIVAYSVTGELDGKSFVPV
jgi:hypothetical protein